MPYINITTNTPIPAEKREAIISQLGRDMSLIGKDEAWLMSDFRENSVMYFDGSDKPAAMVSLDLVGAAAAKQYDRFTAAVTKQLFEQLGIPTERVYVKYGEYARWGVNGINVG
jgi:phenylpyruvate tautomerase PptA (4-oxalocrotonate tautomerase family)